MTLGSPCQARSSWAAGGGGLSGESSAHQSLSQSVAYTEVTEIKRDYINTIQHSLLSREQPFNSTGAMTACVRSGDILSIWDLSRNMDTH